MLQVEKVEKEIKDFVMNQIFSERPEENNDWDLFMSNETLEEPYGFEVCQEYEYENARNLRGLMQTMFDDLIDLNEDISLKEVYILSQYDIWFSHASRVCFGIYDSLKKAKDAMQELFGEEGFELYSTEDDLQWTNDDIGYGLMIESYTLNEIGEM